MRWCPATHAIVNKNLGEKTVQINKCSRRAMHATMTANVLKAVNSVKSAKCLKGTCDLGLAKPRPLISKVVAETHQIGPAQLLRKVKIPTPTTLYPLMPL